MIVVTNRIPVAEGHEEAFEERFRHRVHLVDRAPGFIRNEVHRPRPMKFDHETGGWNDDPDGQGYYEVKTWWRSLDDFVAWTQSPAFAEAHKNRPPKQMFAGPNELEIHEVFLSTERGGDAVQEPAIRRDVGAWLRGVAEAGSDDVLAEMHRRASEHRFPIVGPEVGRLLAQVVHMLGARRVFEMGSGFGYSTLWFARAVGEQGKVWFTDGDPHNAQLARDFLGRAGVAGRVTMHTGDALELLAQTPGEFDVIFCDVDKAQYPAAYDVLRDRVRVGGAVIIDNLVWSGRVAAGAEDPATAGIREYVRRMWGDDRFLSSLLPVRDGVGLSLRLR